MIVPHDERGVFVDGFAGEEEAFGEASLVAFDGLAYVVFDCVLAVAVQMSSVVGIEFRHVVLVLRRRCCLFERLLAIGMLWIMRHPAGGELDVPFLAIALDHDMVTAYAKDVFEDSQSQLWWQTEETGLCVQH